jgi:hypothetical protein
MLMLAASAIERGRSMPSGLASGLQVELDFDIKSYNQINNVATTLHVPCIAPDVHRVYWQPRPLYAFHVLRPDQRQVVYRVDAPLYPGSFPLTEKLHLAPTWDIHMFVGFAALPARLHGEKT